MACSEGNGEEGSGTNSSLAQYAADWLHPGAARDYELSRTRGRFRNYDREERLVGRWLRLCQPGALVLDVPCGSGRFSQLVAKCGHHLLRADLSQVMVSHARQAGPNGHSIGDLCCDLGKPPLRPGSVDVVLLWRLFHHCHSDHDRGLMLRRAAELARRYIILSFYNRENVTFWGRRVIRAALKRPPKGTGAVWTRDLIAMAGTLELEVVEVRHYRRGISMNSAVCFRVHRAEATS